MPYELYGKRSHKMMQTKNTHVWSLAGEETVAYSRAGRKAAAVTRESGEVAACSLEGDSSHLNSGRNREKTPKSLLALKQKELPSTGLDSMRGADHVSTNY